MKREGTGKIPLRVGAFILIFCILFLGLEKFCFDDRSLWPTWKTLQSKEGEKPDILILGNSNAYTTLNALYLSEAFEKNVQILASDSQIMPITLENYKVVSKYQNPKIIILEMTSIIFNTRDSLRNEQKGSAMVNFDGISNYWDKLRAVSSFFKPQDILESMFQLLRPSSSWSRFPYGLRKMKNERKQHNPYENLNMNGYMGKNTISHFEYSKYENIDEVLNSYLLEDADYFIPEYNEKALASFLELAENNGTEIWLFKSPNFRLRRKEIERIEELVAYSPAVSYVDDMTIDFKKIGLTEEDYYDVGHLNRRGAAKVTRYYADLIEERLGWEQKSGVFAYQDEQAEKLEDGRWKYTVYNEDPNTLYRFCLYHRETNTLADIQDFSNKNDYIFEEDILESNKYRLEVTMLPEDADYKETAVIAERGMRISFMVYNDSVIKL